MQEIDFYLQADLNFKQEPIVNEYFHFYGSGKNLRGRVDAAVVAQNPKEYETFSALVKSQSLIEKALAAPGKAIYPEAPAVIEEAPAVETKDQHEGYA